MSHSRLSSQWTRQCLRNKLGACSYSRQSLLYIHGSATSRPLAQSCRCTKRNFNNSSRAYPAPAKVRTAPPQNRNEIIERLRIGFYGLAYAQGVSSIDKVKANSIVKEFLARQKTSNHADNIKHLSSKYGTSIEDLASIAIVTYRVPDQKYWDKGVTENRSVATSMLKGCAQMADPLATIQILSAVYLAGISDSPVFRDYASFFNQAEVSRYIIILAKLGAKSTTFPLGPEALTLQGLFAEKEGNIDKAESLYTEAVQRVHFKYNSKSRHPMQLPMIAPWNALGNLLKSCGDPVKKARAREYFKRGALEGDDPLSYYELAAFEQRTDPIWLQYISKAAASGHREATVDLAEFYREASLKDSPVLVETSMRKALNWLLEWKRGSAAKLANEWLHAASLMGHKPSALQLADHCEKIGDQEGAKEHLRMVVEPPSRPSQVEEWPQLVQMAKKRLAGIKV